MHPPAHATTIPSTAPGEHALQQIEQLQAAVGQLQNELEHQGRLATLGTIAGLIAHEFNNILTPVLSYGQMAMARPDDHDLVAKALTKAVEGAERAAGIAAAILGFVRDDAQARPGSEGNSGGEASPTTSPASSAPTTADVLQAMEQALACLGRDPERDGIGVVFHVEPDTRAAIRTLALQHVLLNLILNARNAMLPRGGTLRLAARRADAPPPVPPHAATSGTPACRSHRSEGRGDPHPGWIVIEVSDTGRGMNEDRLRRLFVPFQTTGTPRTGRPSNAPVDRRGGTGLGLLVCKRLVDEAGGVLFATSEPGRGTVFTITLPSSTQT